MKGNLSSAEFLLDRRRCAFGLHYHKNIISCFIIVMQKGVKPKKTYMFRPEKTPSTNKIGRHFRDWIGVEGTSGLGFWMGKSEAGSEFHSLVVIVIMELTMFCLIYIKFDIKGMVYVWKPCVSPHCGFRAVFPNVGPMPRKGTIWFLRGAIQKWARPDKYKNLQNYLLLFEKINVNKIW